MSWTKAKIFWPICLALLLADCGTKRVAVDRLTPHVPQEVVGDVVRFTLAYNPGAAFGLFAFGPGSRWVLTVAAVLALCVLGWLYRRTAPAQTLQVMALALVAGGAVGNLIDRLRPIPGVVDFVDIGVGSVRFWTFNVADAGITVGALVLMASLAREPVETGRPVEREDHAEDDERGEPRSGRRMYASGSQEP